MIIYGYIGITTLLILGFAGLLPDSFVWFGAIPFLVLIGIWRFLELLFPGMTELRSPSRSSAMLYTLPGLLERAASRDRKAVVQPRNLVHLTPALTISIGATFLGFSFYSYLLFLNFADFSASYALAVFLLINIWLLISFSGSAKNIKRIFQFYIGAYLFTLSLFGIRTLMESGNMITGRINDPYPADIKVLTFIIIITLLPSFVSFIHYAFKRGDKFALYGLMITSMVVLSSFAVTSSIFALPVMATGWGASITCWIYVLKHWRKKYHLFAI